MVLDTNVLIDYLRGDERVIEAVRGWFANGTVLLISAITYAEVLAYKAASESELNEMRRFLENFVLIPIDRTMAEEIAAVRREERVKIPDAAIVATARSTASPLVTRDKRLYTVRGIQVVAI